MCTGLPLYFLIAPKVIPLRRCFLKKMVNIITGKRNIKVDAAMAPQSTPPTPIWLGINGGAVSALLVVIINAKAYSFHAVMKQNTTVAAIPVAA